MIVTSWSLAISSRARLRPTLPAPTMIAYMASSRGLGLGLERALEHLDRVLGRGDRVQPLFAVPAGSRRVHHAHDHLLRPESALGDLGDDQVGVVSVGRGDEHVCALDARLDQRVDLERRADRELTAGVLPTDGLAGVQALVGERVLVEHRDIVAGGERRLGDGRADTPGPHDHHEHAPQVSRCDGPRNTRLHPYQLCFSRRERRSASESPAAGAVTITRQRALSMTYLVTSPTKFSSGPPRPPRRAPPRISEGSSAPSTIASTPRRLASSTIACPARRVRTVAVATCTPVY